MRCAESPLTLDPPQVWTRPIRLACPIPAGSSCTQTPLRASPQCPCPATCAAARGCTSSWLYHVMSRIGASELQAGWLDRRCPAARPCHRAEVHGFGHDLVFGAISLGHRMLDSGPAWFFHVAHTPTSNMAPPLGAPWPPRLGNPLAVHLGAVTPVASGRCVDLGIYLYSPHSHSGVSILPDCRAPPPGRHAGPDICLRPADKSGAAVPCAWEQRPGILPPYGSWRPSRRWRRPAARRHAPPVWWSAACRRSWTSPAWVW